MKFRVGRLSMHNERRRGWPPRHYSAIFVLVLGSVAGTWTAAQAAGEHSATTAPERAHAVETDSLFGFTEGSDTGDAGERELSYQITGRRLLRRNGYSASDNALNFEYGYRDDLKLGVGASLDGYRFARPRPSDIMGNEETGTGEAGEVLQLMRRRSI